MTTTTVASRRSSSASSSSASRRRRNESFPNRLHHMLEDAMELGFDDIVCWLAHGRAFKIHDRARFEAQLLPLYFERQTVYTSYGFLRLVCTGRDQDACYHELFLCGRPELCAGIVRTPKAKHSTHHRRYDPTTVPYFDALPPLPFRTQQQRLRTGPLLNQSPRPPVATSSSRPEVLRHVINHHHHGFYYPTVSNQNAVSPCLYRPSTFGALWNATVASPSRVTHKLVSPYSSHAAATASNRSGLSHYWFELPLWNGVPGTAPTARIQVGTVTTQPYQDAPLCQADDAADDDWEPLPLYPSCNETSGTGRLSALTTVTLHGSMDDSNGSSNSSILDASGMSPIGATTTTVWSDSAIKPDSGAVPTEIATDDWHHIDSVPGW
jgi:HSF-type DNA-binding